MKRGKIPLESDAGTLAAGYDVLKKLKLYCVCNLAELSGAPTSARLHARLLRPYFAEVEVIFEEHGPQEEFCKKDGLPCRVLPLLHTGLRTGRPMVHVPRNLLRVIKSRFDHVGELRRLLRSTPCLLHVHSLCAPWALVAGRLAPVPVVLHVREARRPGIEAWLEERVAVWSASRIVTVSEGIRRQYGTAFQKKAITLYNFLDARGSEESDATVAGQGAEPPVVALVANMHEGKGVEVFITICRLLRERGVVFRGWLVGPFARKEFEQHCRDLVRQTGLSGVVEFKGAQTDMAACYRRMHLLVHPTRRDSLPRAVMEAMAYGIPVVASKVDGVPEMIEEAVTGFLVAPDDVIGFVDRVQFLLSRPGERQRIGRAAQERARQHFSPETYTTRMLEIYRDVLARSGYHAQMS